MMKYAFRPVPFPSILRMLSARHFLALVLPVAALVATGAASARAADRSEGDEAVVWWPDFRGPTQQGHADARHLPLTWSNTKNVVWKMRIPGRAWSSPVIRGNQIWLTNCIEPKKTLHAVCLDRESGKIVHDVVVFRKADLGRIFPKNSYASPSPVIDGDRVYVHFGRLGTACLNAGGKVLWKTVLNYYHHNGPASSPIVVGNALIVNCDGFDGPFYDRIRLKNVKHFQSVVALDKRTGKLLWQTPRTNGRHSYCTPIIITVDGKLQVVSPGGDQVAAYDPQTGKELWKCRYKGYSVVPRPVFARGMVFLATGFDTPMLFALKTGGRGDVTDTHVVWKTRRGAPADVSPLIVGDELYTITDGGVMTCFDVKTGRIHWRQRLGGRFYASPISAAGRIYATSTVGSTFVLAPGKTFQRLAVNRIRGRVYASMAVADRSLFLRTQTDLFRFEEQK